MSDTGSIPLFPNHRLGLPLGERIRLTADAPIDECWVPLRVHYAPTRRANCVGCRRNAAQSLLDVVLKQERRPGKRLRDVHAFG
jgi:hypothetical protein